MTARACLHGHFYQPPREDPWTGEVPRERTAHPWRDWNRRILAECYGPLAGTGVGYRRSLSPLAGMSFNFGPTLLHWLDRHAPAVSAAVVAADRRGLEASGGYGPAMAQAYNHLLLPLSPRRDQEIQVHWGLREFRRRFGREARGLWLPETAMDETTLAVAAAAGVAFVILAPHQARRVRLEDGAWHPTPDGEGLETARPWRCRLPGGGEIACFFFQRDLSLEISFGGLPARPGALAKRLAGSTMATGAGGLLLAASDGEVYGHHCRGGAAGLAQGLARARRAGVGFAVPDQVLAEEGVAGEVEVAPRTSWSCRHGVARWEGHCGCRAGGPEEWSQAWKTPLREALSWLREQAAAAWSAQAPGLFSDPSRALREAVDLFPRFPEGELDLFLGRNGRSHMNAAERRTARELLDLQRTSLHALTSCGFFFDDLAGLEPLQALRFAARTLELLAPWAPSGLAGELRARLRPARSNQPGGGDGWELLRRVAPPGLV